MPGSKPWTTSKLNRLSAYDTAARIPTGIPTLLPGATVTVGAIAITSASAPFSNARRPAARSRARPEGARTVTLCPSLRSSAATPATCSLTS